MIWFSLAFLFHVAGPTPLPASPDIPPGPPGLEAPAEIGGAGMLLSGAAAEGAPVIAMMSETAGPDETASVTGKNLDGAVWHYAVDGQRPLIRSVPGQVLSVSAADRSAVVLPDVDSLKGTTLVFAEKNGLFSRPFRINGPRMFWLSPASVRQIKGDTSGNLLTVYGKNLFVPGSEPRLYISGPGRSGFQTVLASAHENRIQCVLPEDLQTGKYSVWVHNGTGRSHGWSAPLSFSVFSSSQSSKSIRTAAPVEDPSENRMNIQALLDEGGPVELQAGRYVIDQPLVISSHYTTLRGVSCGTGFDYESGTVSGAVHTVIGYDGTNCLDEVIRVEARNTVISDLVLINGHGGGVDRHQLIEVREKTCEIRNVRFVLYDDRAWGPGGPPRKWANSMIDPNPSASGATDAYIDDGCVFFNYSGDVRGLVDSCHFHTVSTGVRIGTLQNSDLTLNAVVPAVRQVSVRNSVFYGYYAGEANRKANANGSGRATGVVIYNGKEIEVSGNHFQSVNRAQRRMLNRSVLSFNSSTRDVYISDNTSFDCGTATWAPMPNNQGEQFLFHYRYTKGGLFDVISSEGRAVTVNTSVGTPDAGYLTRWYAQDQRGGWVPGEVGKNDHWFVFVVDGTGIGQYRRVTAMSKEGSTARFELESDWRLRPDSGSRICLFVPMHHLIVRDNHVDCGNLGGTKTHLVTLWNDCIDNIIRGNTGVNLSAGVTVNGMLWGPNSWNLVEGNTFSNMYRFTGGDVTSITNAFIAFQFATTRETAPGNTIWPTEGLYGIGNAARHNFGEVAGCGAVMANAYYGDSSRHTDPFEEHESLAGRGMQLCVFEKNRFEQVGAGVLADCSVQSGIVRKNRFSGVSTNRFIIFRPGHEPPLAQILELENSN
jgi:hypothetical protein